MNKTKLVLPDRTYAASYIEALREGHFLGIGRAKTPEEIESIEKDFDKHTYDLNDQTKPAILPSGEVVKRVPGNHFWLVQGDRFIGETNVRYELSEFLLNIGGHVGYGIRPSYRKQGYGTIMLKLALEKLKEKGVKRVLVSCAEDNLASQKVIENNGGVLENKVPSPFHSGGLARRYWIELK